jgi:hypothetical protein
MATFFLLLDGDETYREDTEANVFSTIRSGIVGNPDKVLQVTEADALHGDPRGSCIDITASIAADLMEEIYRDGDLIPRTCVDFIEGLCGVQVGRVA